eukprot:scaffold23_cov268-Pinguiococcus_pyrenoidosus.AAC.3
MLVLGPSGSGKPTAMARATSFKRSRFPRDPMNRRTVSVGASRTIRRGQDEDSFEAADSAGSYLLFTFGDQAAGQGAHEIGLSRGSVLDAEDETRIQVVLQVWRFIYRLIYHVDDLSWALPGQNFVARLGFSRIARRLALQLSDARAVGGLWLQLSWRRRTLSWPELANGRDALSGVVGPRGMRGLSNLGLIIRLEGDLVTLRLGLRRPRLELSNPIGDGGLFRRPPRRGRAFSGGVATNGRDAGLRLLGQLAISDVLCNIR